MNKLQGTIAHITGGNSGINRANLTIDGGTNA